MGNGQFWGRIEDRWRALNGIVGGSGKPPPTQKRCEENWRVWNSARRGPLGGEVPNRQIFLKMDDDGPVRENECGRREHCGFNEQCSINRDLRLRLHPIGNEGISVV